MAVPVIDARRLAYFVAVAEERSFARAADRLHLSQPALSEAVKRLEAELSAQLLVRTSRRVDLTAAGAVLLEEGRDALAMLERAGVRAQAAAAGRRGTLRLGFLATGAGELGAAARAAFARSHPDVAVVLRRFDWGQEVEALRAGEVDCAFAWLPADLHGLEHELVALEPRVAGLPCGHRLALAGGEIDVSELDREPIVWTKLAPRPWVDWWAVNPRPDGSQPRWGPTCENVEEMLEHVASGAAYCIAPASMARFHNRPDLAWLPLAGVEPLRIVLAWRSGEDAGPVAAFRDEVRRLARIPETG